MMLEKIIDFSIKNKLIAILFTLTIAAFGLYSITKIPIGAVPDITNNQVQVITTSANLSTQEIEQFITTPVEIEMANLPGVTEIRSVSKFGLSVVTIVFEDNIGTYLPRQLIAEKIKTASENIPDGFGIPEMGPITTGLGEIYQYIIDVKPGYEDRYSAMELRTIQDWIVKRYLSGIKGVVEVNSWGGYLKQYEVAIDPNLMLSFDITMMEVFNALESNNSISGGAYIEKRNQSYFIRGDGLIKSLNDIENIVIKNNNGTPILIRDLAKVHYGFANRFGAITANGEGEKVLGQIMMLKDANSKEVINEVKERVAEVQNSLPEGVFINPILERSELISKTSTTIIENLLLGCIIVIIVVFLLLGNVRSALVIASMIPLSLLFTLSMMYIFGIDANLMSLGALDFGIIIDGAVIIVEFIAIRITAKSNEYNKLSGDGRQTLLDKITYKGASKMMNSAVFGQIIILIVFIPILSLQGVEGKMFHPMAITFSFAIIGAMILGLTWLPVASSLFLKPQKENSKGISVWIMNLAYRSYDPVIKWSCNNKGLVLGASMLSLIATGYVFYNMGGEFVPTLDEGDFVIQPVLKTGTSLTKTIEMSTKMEQILIENFPEVDQIVSRIGAAEVPTDPMSMEEIDVIIKLKPKSEWVSASSKEELAEKFKDALSVLPGIEYEFTQPIEMRFNELITGVRADIAIKIFGEDLEYLSEKASEIKSLIKDIPGAVDIIIEKTEGLPQMNVTYNRDKIAYYGLDIKTINNYLAMAFGGEHAGSVFELEKRFDLVVRLQEENRMDIDNIERLRIPLQSGKQIPLKEVADIKYTEGPAKISRENTHRRVVVSVNVRNADLQTVVDAIQKKINENISLEPGNTITYGGQFENLQNATKRLIFAVPLALILIFLFLHFAFKSFKDAVMIFTAVPLSTVGGVFLLWIRGMPFSVSAGIGFIALFGIAVLNGIVLIEHLKDLKQEGMTNMRSLIYKGTKDRLRPVMLTAAAAAMGFLPMAISTGAGAEVQRPLATVVIGGLITSTMLTMIALPLLFEIFNNVTGIQLWPLKLKRTKAISSIILILFSTTLAFGQGREISLDDALLIANKNNIELSAYKLRVDEAKVLKGTALSVDKTLIHYDFDQNNIADNGYPLNVFGVEQNFNFPTVYSSKSKLIKHNVSIVENELFKKKINIENKITKSFYKLQYLLNKQNIYYKIDSLANSFYSNTEFKYSQGDISKLDLLNAKVKQQQVQLSVNQIKRNIDIEYIKLASLMQYDSTFKITNEELIRIPISTSDIESNSSYKGMKLQTVYQTKKLKLEKNKLLPDVTLGYFVGTNNHPNSENYQGFLVGLGLPLFYGEQKAIIKANKITIHIRENLENYYLLRTKSEYEELQNKLMIYTESITFYNNTGKQLSNEIIRTSERSYELGEIDFFQFVLSVENALSITLDYLDNLSNYNEVAIDINYLTK